MLMPATKSVNQSIWAISNYYPNSEQKNITYDFSGHPNAYVNKKSSNMSFLVYSISKSRENNIDIKLLKEG